MEQSEAVTRLMHARLTTLLALLAVVDAAFVVWCSAKVLDAGPSVFLLFGFEFLLLGVALATTALRYVLLAVDARLDGAWAAKFTYLFYLELVSEIVKLVVYLVFFLLIFTYYGMPLHIVRDLWVSAKTLQRRIASYLRYRQITRNLNERFPTPTAEELAATDRTCIICREEMTPASCKTLPCAHIFHIDCLKMWLQRQQTCPTCRATIPTGPRPQTPPPVPPPAQAQAQVQAPAQAPAPAAVAQAQAPVGHVPQAPAQAPAPAHAHAHAHGHAPAAPAAVPHHHAAFQPAAAGHPAGFPQVNPFMSPLMYNPFGFGMAGAYGVAPPHAPAMDPAAIQRQLDQLHAQLAALQAAAGPYSGAPATPATPTLTPVPMPAPAAATTPAVTPAAPTASAPAPPPTPAPAPAAPTSASNPAPASEEELEDKAPVPEERAIPPAPMTEAERRREELRQRYARIYGSNGDEAKAE